MCRHVGFKMDEEKRIGKLLGGLIAFCASLRSLDE